MTTTNNTATTHPTTHTPGPWYVAKLTYKQDGHEHIGAASIEPNICDMTSSLSPEQVMTNATLIAAAPALLEALHGLLGELGDLEDGSVAELQCHWCGRDYEDLPSGSFCQSDDCPGFKARQAIAQATGR